MSVSNYTIGQEVEVICERLSGGTYNPYRSILPSPMFETDEWEIADIKDIQPHFKLSIYVVFRSDKLLPGACWVAPEVVRPINHKPSIVKPSAVLHSFCAECKDVFIYPVEANCAEGRVCYSCRSSYGWKYKFI